MFGGNTHNVSFNRAFTKTEYITFCERSKFIVIKSGKPSSVFLTLVVLIFFLMIPLDGCKKDNENPVAPPALKPGKRDYTFTVDTLTYVDSYQLDMQCMWASSASDVYVGGYNDLGKGVMFHYNGTIWSSVHLSISEGGPISGFISINAMDGTGHDNIWAVGERTHFSPTRDSSLILHNDGSGWTEFPAHGGRALYCVFALTTEDAWAGGIEGTLFHLKLAKWDKVSLQFDYLISSFAGTSSSDLYSIGFGQSGSPPYAYLLKYGGAQWSVVDSVSSSPDSATAAFGERLVTTGGKVYSCGPNIYEREGSSWTKIFGHNIVSRMYQSDANNIFAVGNSIFEFNGTDWHEYPQFRNAGFQYAYKGCYTDGNEVFILGSTVFKSYVIHGK